MTVVGEGGRVLVTGAAGRLGSVVLARLVGGGWDVVATDVAAARDGAAVPIVEADLRDHRVVLELLTGVDAVVHLANHPGIGSTPPQVVFNDNVAMNENVFQGAAEQGVGRIVFTSTLQLIGSHPDTRTVVSPPPAPRFPLDGRTEPAPANVYALSKTVSEVMLRYYAERCGIDAVALRFPLLHHGQDDVLVGTGEETPVDVAEGFTGLHVDDAASVVHAVLAADLAGYHAYMPATSHRHRDLPVPELLARHYPQVPPDTPDLVDVTALTDATGWRPADSHHAHHTTSGGSTT